MFRYLNLSNVWPDFRLEGLINDGGALRLARKAASRETGGPLPGIALDAAGLSGPASIGMDADGNVYIPDPGANRIIVRRACDGLTGPLRCMVDGHEEEGEEDEDEDRGSGSPGRLKAPRGVLAGPRGALYVADSGNHRILVIDQVTLQLRGIWGQADPHGEPVAGGGIGLLNDPWGLAADSMDFVYVADLGNRRVQKFDADGNVVSGFWERLQEQDAVPGEPSYIAAALIDGEERLLVVDRMPSRILAYRTDGTHDAAAGKRWLALAEGLPGGMVLLGDGSCAGNAGSVPALVFDEEGGFIREIQHHGAPSGLALDGEGRLHIRSGAAMSLLPGQAYFDSGRFAAGPFDSGGMPVRWHRIQAVVGELPSNTHIRFFTFTAPDRLPPSLPPAHAEEVEAGTEPTGAGIWRPVPMDAHDFLVLHEPAPYLWIGGILEGDGEKSPVLRQMRLEFEHDGWLRYLPAIYARGDTESGLLERALALFESVLGDVESDIHHLPALFDAWAAPDHAPESWLDWLSGWLAFPIEESWEPEKRRRALAGAFDALGRRGTVQGLKQFIAWYADIEVTIEEPASNASVWSLGENSALGFTTMIAAAEAGGAVLGTTATLDGSHLIGEADFGAPLFEDLAHQFCVLVPPTRQLHASGALEALQRVIDREKPAHTSYRIHVLEPRMRVGLQARVGMDTIVGGPAPAMVLDADSELGAATALAKSEYGHGSILDGGARVGVGIRLA